MKFKVLYLCALCAQALSDGATLTALPKTDNASSKARKCEWCKKQRHGDLYYIKSKEQR